MNTLELTTALETALENADLRHAVSATISLIRKHNQIAIVAHGEKCAENKDSILSTYRLRQKHLAKTGATLLGFDGTIISLAKCHADRIFLVLVNVSDESIALWLDSSGSIVGCHFGKGSKIPNADGAINYP